MEHMVHVNKAFATWINAQAHNQTLVFLKQLFNPLALPSDLQGDVPSATRGHLSYPQLVSSRKAYGIGASVLRRWSHLCQSWVASKLWRWAAQAARWALWSQCWRLCVQSVARSTAAGRTIFTTTVWRWMMTWCATSACSRLCSHWIRHVDTLSVHAACEVSSRRETSVLWTGHGCSCKHAADPASWWTSCWTSCLCRAPWHQSAPSACHDVTWRHTSNTGDTPYIQNTSTTANTLCSQMKFLRVRISVYQVLSSCCR